MKTKNIILAFLVIMLAFMAACQQKVIVNTAQSSQGEVSNPSSPVSAPAAPPQAEAASVSSQAVEGRVPEISYCSIDYAVSYKAGSCAFSEESITLTLKASRAEISGMAFQVAGKSGKSYEFKDSTDVPINKWQSYVFSTADIRQKVDGQISSIVILPLTDVNGEEKACKNQRLLVIKEESCRI